MKNQQKSEDWQYEANSNLRKLLMLHLLFIRWRSKIVESLLIEWGKPVVNKANASIPLELFWYSTLVVIIWWFITSCDVHPSYCGYAFVVCSVFNNILEILTVWSKKVKLWIYCCIRLDHESNSSRKLS